MKFRVIYFNKQSFFLFYCAKKGLKLLLRNDLDSHGNVLLNDATLGLFFLITESFVRILQKCSRYECF